MFERFTESCRKVAYYHEFIHTLSSTTSADSVVTGDVVQIAAAPAPSPGREVAKK
jgi:hypothetical protein